MKKIAFLFVACTLGLVSCSKSDSNISEESPRTAVKTFLASAERNSTKTTVTEKDEFLAFNWSVGDEVVLMNASTGKYAAYSVSAADDEGNGTFENTDNPLSFGDEDGFMAFFPSDMIFFAEVEESELWPIVSFPKEQEYGSDGEFKALMAAAGEGRPEDVGFSHLGGALRLKVCPDLGAEISVASITISSSDYLAGFSYENADNDDFSMVLIDPSEADDPEAVSKTVAMVMETGASAGKDNPLNAYFSLPATHNGEGDKLKRAISETESKDVVSGDGYSEFSVEVAFTYDSKSYTVTKQFKADTFLKILRGAVTLVELPITASDLQ